MERALSKSSAQAPGAPQERAVLLRADPRRTWIAWRCHELFLLQAQPRRVFGRSREHPRHPVVDFPLDGREGVPGRKGLADVSGICSDFGACRSEGWQTTARRHGGMGGGGGQRCTRLTRESFVRIARVLLTLAPTLHGVIPRFVSLGFVSFGFAGSFVNTVSCSGFRAYLSPYTRRLPVYRHDWFRHDWT